MGQERVLRVSEEIKKEVGMIIQNELKDSRIGFVTVTKVDLSRDCRFAKIYFSLLGTKKQLCDTEIGLSHSRGFIRKLLGQRLKLRYTPDIVFKLDKNIKYSIHISEVLDKISKEERLNERKRSNQNDKKLF